MANLNPFHFAKILNPNLALAALASATPHGEFKAYVRLAKSGRYPASLKSTRVCANGLIKGRIACSQIRALAADSNVVSIELREHIALASGAR
ncbi:MAG: hypothetical protein ABTQ34_04130 [Bdellovibrionales bacterium]